MVRLDIAAGKSIHKNESDIFSTHWKLIRILNKQLIIFVL